MTTATFLLYLGTWTLVAIAPGPAVLYVMSLAVRGGVRGSVPGIAGLQLGGLLFFTAVGTGLAALLATMTTLFTVVRIAGALYLCWIGANLLFPIRKKTVGKEHRGVQAAEGISRMWAFWQGLLVQLTNPKAFLFATALLPQFLDVHRPMLPQVWLLFVVACVIDTTSMVTYATLTARGVGGFRSSRAVLWLERVFGAALIGVGVRIAFSKS